MGVIFVETVQVVDIFAVRVRKSKRKLSLVFFGLKQEIEGNLQVSSFPENEGTFCGYSLPVRPFTLTAPVPEDRPVAFGCVVLDNFRIT